jgi:hypothetical protein
MSGYKTMITLYKTNPTNYKVEFTTKLMLKNEFEKKSIKKKNPKQ